VDLLAGVQRVRYWIVSLTALSMMPAPMADQVRPVISWVELCHEVLPVLLDRFAADAKLRSRLFATLGMFLAAVLLEKVSKDELF